MRKNLLVISPLALLLCLAGCGGGNKPAQPEPFLSVSQLVEKEISRLQHSDHAVAKVIEINGKKDSLILQPELWEKNPGFWKKEFEALTSFKVKPEWGTLFSVDSGQTIYPPAITRSFYTYNSKDSSLPVSRVEIEKAGGEIMLVKLSTNTKENIYNTHRTAVLIPGIMLKVNSRKSTIVIGEDDMSYTIYLDQQVDK